MKKYTKYYLVILPTIFAFKANAQQWQPGDTLNTKKQDSIRINEFRDNVIDYTGQDLIDASFPNSIPLFGSKSRIAFGVYVKLDYIQNFDRVYDRFQYEIQNVPISGDGRVEQSGYMNMHARESRLNLDFRGVSEAGQQNTLPANRPFKV